MGEQEGIKLGEQEKECLESGVLKIGRTQIGNNWLGGKEFKWPGYLGLSG